MHDFADQDLGKAVPYGVYDVAANTGWVNVGTDHDTSQFAVQAIRRWWDTVGKDAYPDAGRLLICADGGGSNGHRTRLWKTELAELAAETGMEISVCDLPPGTSKWNEIEHRLFSHISMNWRGKPLTSHEVIVNTIAATTTRTGLKVHAELDTAAIRRHQDSRPGDEGAGTGRTLVARFPRRLELHPARQAGRHAQDRPKLIPRELLRENHSQMSHGGCSGRLDRAASEKDRLNDSTVSSKPSSGGSDRRRISVHARRPRT